MLCIGGRGGGRGVGGGAGGRGSVEPEYQRENTRQSHACTVRQNRTIVCTRVMCVYLIEHVQREPSFGMSAGDCVVIKTAPVC